METNPRHFLFLLGSARSGGNTETLARVAAESLPSDTLQTWISLDEVRLPVFADIRHDADLRYRISTPAEQTLLDATLAATDIVFASPVYWYSVSSSTKLYLDHWSGWMRLEGVDFRPRMAGKNAWAVSVLSDEDISYARPLIDTLRLSAEYMDMRWCGELLGYGSRPGDIDSDDGSLSRARSFFA